MTSLGKLQGALGIISNESTLALANLNFDFSLFKVVAPKEFAGLGATLSTQRRVEAEEGACHQTARRVGALFEQILPNTPDLVRAYGERTTAISELPEVNPRGTRSHGIFERQVGADGTSIWAAATSGPSSIAAHLLACMLARIWSPDKATSVWVQIVAQRKVTIRSTNDGTQSHHLSTLLASQQTISRKELANWDASARAWLRRADEAKAHQQTQLMLIIKNVNLPVNNIGDTYESVIQAWKIAMGTMDKLLKGMPQLVQNGAILLGLSSWHLYPNLNVLSTGQKEIILNDTLVPPGGILSIGLQDITNETDYGVRWSLPLAHLKYYGQPVVSSGTISQATERVSMEDFNQVVLGSVLTGWGFSTAAKAYPAIETLSAMWMFLKRAVPKVEAEINELHKSVPWELLNKSQVKTTDEANLTKLSTLGPLLEGLNIIVEEPGSWPALLAATANEFIISKGMKREQYEMLHGLGRRKHDFLGKPLSDEEPLFGFCSSTKISQLCKDQTTRISILRQLSKCLSLPDGAIIKYDFRVDYDEFGYDECPILAGLATATVSLKRDHEGSLLGSPSHCRWWATEHGAIIDGSDVTDINEAWDELDPVGEHSIGGMQFISKNVSTPYGPGFTWFDPPAQFQADSDGTLESEAMTLFCHIYGDPGDAALYMACRNKAGFSNTSKKIQGISWSHAARFAFESDSICPSKLVEYFQCAPGLLPNDPYTQSLKGICIATELYRAIHGATISLEIVNMPLYEALWIPSSKKPDKVPSHNSETPASEREVWVNLGDPTLPVSTSVFDLLPHRIATKSPLAIPGMTSRDTTSRASVEVSNKGWSNWKPPPIDRASAFGCIAYFESGLYNIAPAGLQHVMALSSGDSLYVAAALICDPDGTPPKSEIRRIIGNVGLPGIAMLVPPSNQLVRKANISQYMIVRHDDYDETLTDEFSETQMELSFSGYDQSINIGSHGARDDVAFFLEALIRVHDAGKWVADIDVLSALDSPLFRRCSCKCDKIVPAFSGFAKPMASFGTTVADDDSAHAPEPLAKNSPPQLIAIDNWEELLQRPPAASIVRAHHNWLARLATTSFCVNRGYPTYVLPEKVCWNCVNLRGYPSENNVFIL
ncbi:hypothetical protein B0J14DRAFT_282630 [Halenospora varia]|nr:hypothetical protein B0J14DRAFT_282630 [Halenospora varia]